MNDLNTHVDLNILMLGYYDLLIVMEWLEKHKFMLNAMIKHSHAQMIKVIPLL